MILTIHKYIGLALALNFIFLCLSGLILIWKDELGPYENNSSIIKLTEESFVNTENYLLTHYPDKKILSLFKNEHGIINVRLGNKDQEKFKGATRLKFDHQGNPIKSIQKATWLDTLLKLHRELYLGTYGKLLLFLVGLFLILGYMLGLKLSFQRLRPRKIKTNKILHTYLHSFIGLKISPWLFLVTLTGMFLALNTILISLFLKGQLNTAVPSQISNSSQKIPLSIVLNSLSLHEKTKNFELDFLAYPKTEFSLPMHYLALMENEKTHLKKIAFISKGTGEITKVVELPWYLKLLVISEPLHFGNYAGLSLKIIWSLFALLATLIPLSGIWMVYSKKRKTKYLTSIFETPRLSFNKTLLGFFTLSVMALYFSGLKYLFLLILLLVILIDWSSLFRIYYKRSALNE